MQYTQAKIDLTIVIPAFNESKKISKDIIAVQKFFTNNNINGEIIVVDDGSSDSTYETAYSLKGSIPTTLIVIKVNENRGKGAAVRDGILKSKGNLVMYADSGLTVPFKNALVGMKLIADNKCDIAMGSRKLIGANIIKGQDFDRKIISKIFIFLIKKLLHIPKKISDTQCGFKIYNGDIARKLFQNLNISGFLFEVEFILLAIKNGYKILEFPISWKCDRDSRLSIRKSAKNIIMDFILLLRQRLFN